MAAMSTRDALAAFDAALRVDESLVVPMRIDVRRIVDTDEPMLQSLVRGVRRRRAAVGGGERRSVGARLAELSPGDRLREVDLLVRREIAVVLGHSGGESVVADKSFSELGFDSLTSVELRNRLGAETGLRLPATLVFDHPTPAAVASLVADELTPHTTDPTPTQDEEMRLRSTLAAIPVDRIRQAGLLDALLGLADTGTEPVPRSVDPDAIDELDTDALIARALEGSQTA
jgi:acyl carrier protein